MHNTTQSLNFGELSFSSQCFIHLSKYCEINYNKHQSKQSSKTTVNILVRAPSRVKSPHGNFKHVRNSSIGNSMLTHCCASYCFFSWKTRSAPGALTRMFTVYKYSHYCRINLQLRGSKNLDEFYTCTLNALINVTSRLFFSSQLSVFMSKWRLDSCSLQNFLSFGG